jgi:hypothetical protein
MMQDKDDAAADEKDVITPKILDGRVETSVRMQFVNPLVGMYHVRECFCLRLVFVCVCVCACVCACVLSGSSVTAGWFRL